MGAVLTVLMVKQPGLTLALTLTLALSLALSLTPSSTREEAGPNANPNLTRRGLQAHAHTVLIVKQPGANQGGS